MTYTIFKTYSPLKPISLDINEHTHYQLTTLMSSLKCSGSPVQLHCEGDDYLVVDDHQLVSFECAYYVDEVFYYLPVNDFIKMMSYRFINIIELYHKHQSSIINFYTNELATIYNAINDETVFLKANRVWFRCGNFYQIISRPTLLVDTLTEDMLLTHDPEMVLKIRLGNELDSKATNYFYIELADNSGRFNLYGYSLDQFGVVLCKKILADKHILDYFSLKVL